MTPSYRFLSPHLDDAAYSCGGLIYDLAAAGAQVEVWTVFAGDPPPGPLTPFAASLHARWGVSPEAGPDAAAARRAEDATACAILGAGARHYPLPDCIYRRLPSGRPVVESDPALFQPFDPEEQPLVEQIRDWLCAFERGLPTARTLVAPLALGGHRDHRLVRAAAQAAAACSGAALCFYADFPYVLRPDRYASDPSLTAGLERVPLPISAAALAAWQGAVAAYRSQLSTFWPDEPAMRAELAAYRAAGGHLWRSETPRTLPKM